uniref:Monodehydroascorbate reductase n=1 Tax=Tanacetum cinerariifolium TaxID=118510 RepID=A0A699IGH0_TANCI|nr:monodehydroascorbate reductase [Tanacetum cinerariifolium]
MAPPMRTDDQSLSHIKWVPIGKSNCYLDVEKSQSNPIYKIMVDILKHTNFFRAFTASSTIPSIYIQQFWDTVRYDKSAGCYRCQLDEQWFDLPKDTLRDALQITPVNNNQAFTSPPSSDALINFVNKLGYPKLTSGFERPMALVLQILWGVVTEAHIDYAKRIWEEFTQSIHTFIEDKRNLAQHTHGKNKATLIVIPSIRFTKLIIYHLQRKHKLHPRPDSPLHLPNEEPVLGYLKFSANGTKREVFGMPIPGSLITADIQGASYYQEYLAKVAKHERYLAGKTGSDPDSPTRKPTKAVKKPKPTVPKADPKPPVSKPVSSKQPERKFAPAKTQGKKRKLTTEISDKPSKAKISRPGLVSKRHKPVSSLRALEESLKSMYDVPQGSLPPVVIREPESGKYQPLLEVPRKGKEKEESEEDILGADAGGQGQARPDPSNAEVSQPMPSPVVHAGSDREHVDLDFTDVSTQPPPEQMDEGFTTTAYPKVQENLKLTVEEQVILKEPASSSGTLSSLQHLTKDLSFGDLFFSDKPSEADNDKATTETEAESMQLKATTTETTTTTILPPPSQQQQQSTTDAMMMKCIGDLEHIMENLIQENKKLEQRLDSHRACLYTLEQLDIPHQVSKAVNEVVADAVDWAMQAPLRNRFRDLPKADMKEILHQRMWETDSYKSHKDHMQWYEALEKSMNRDHSEELAKDLAEARPSGASGSPGAFGSPQVPPPPPLPPSTNQEGQSKGSASPSSSKTAASVEYQAWTTTDIRLRASISLTPVDLQMDDDMAPDEQAQSSDDEDIENAHIPKVNLRQDWWKPLEEERHATSEPAWSISSSDVPVPKNNWASALASNYSPLPEDSLLVQTGDIAMFMDWNNINNPLPLGGPPGQVTIQSNFFFNKDLEYLRYSSKGSRPALSISKIKATYYPNAGLEQMVPDQMWIEEECTYDITAMYGISHWWFQRQRFYIDRHTSEGDRRAVRTHMQILSVVRIEVFPMYGVDGARRVGLGSIFRTPKPDSTRYLQPDPITPLGFEYKHDYTVIDYPRVVTFRDIYGVQMIMRFNEIHKFSDGTLQQIDEALDYRVKEFKINRMNPGLNIRLWTRKDVDRSKEFMFAIQKRLKTRRIFRNLESFVGGRVRDEDYRLLKRTV